MARENCFSNVKFLKTQVKYKYAPSISELLFNKPAVVKCCHDSP